MNPVPIYRAAVTHNELKGRPVEGTKYKVYENRIGLLDFTVEYLGFSHRFYNRWHITFNLGDDHTVEITKDLNDNVTWVMPPDEASYAELRLAL